MTTRSHSLAPRSVAREVLRLTGPAVLTSLLQTIVFLADRVMLGRYSESALASMQISGPVLWSVFSIFFGSMIGAVALVARSIGAGDPDRASEIARTLLRFAAVLGLAVGIVGLVGAAWIADAMAPDASLTIREQAADYTRVFFVGFPAVYVGAAGALVVNAGGDTRTTFRIGIVSNLANVAINYVLIYGHSLGGVEVPALGVSGAAIGSVAAYTIESALIVRALRKPLDLRMGWFATTCPLVVTGLARLSIGELERTTRRSILRLSAPAFAERVVIHAGFLAFARVVTSLGETAMAANQALITLESICFLAAEGFGIAGATVVGQYLGREDPSSSSRGGWIAAGACAAVLGGLGLVIWVTAPWTAAAFVPAGVAGTAMITMVLVTMPILVLSQPVMAVAVVLGHALRGAGDTRSPLWAAVLGGLVVRVVAAVALTLVFEFGLVGIWVATCLDWTVRTVILVAVFARARWQTISLDAPSSTRAPAARGAAQRAGMTPLTRSGRTPGVRTTNPATRSRSVDPPEKSDTLAACSCSWLLLHSCSARPICRPHRRCRRCRSRAKRWRPSKVQRPSKLLRPKSRRLSSTPRCRPTTPHLRLRSSLSSHRP